MGVHISFNGQGVPQISDPTTLQAIATQGPDAQQWQSAVNILTDLSADSFNSTTGAEQGQAINFAFQTSDPNNPVQVTLPNPGHVFDNLAPALNGHTGTPAQFNAMIKTYLTSALGKIGSVGAQSLMNDGVNPQTANEVAQISQNPNAGASTGATMNAAGAMNPAGTTSGTSAPAAGGTNAAGAAAAPFNPDDRSWSVGSATSPVVASGQQWQEGQNINMQALLNPSNSDLMSPSEIQMVKALPAAEQQQYLLQKHMEWETRLSTLLSNLLKMRHDAMMSIIGNIRSS